MNKVHRIYLTASLALVAFSSLAVGAMAQTAAEYELDGVSGGIKAQIQEALSVALPIAGALIALAVGWRLLRRMVKA